MRVINYNIEDYKHIKCMLDFYEAIGILNDFKNGVIRNVTQVRMCYVDCDTLLKYILNNVPKAEKKHFKNWDVAYRMDWLNYSPKTDDNLPNGVLYIDEIE